MGKVPRSPRQACCCRVGRQSGLRGAACRQPSAEDTIVPEKELGLGGGGGGHENWMGGLALFQAVPEARLVLFTSWCEMLGLCYFWQPHGDWE